MSKNCTNCQQEFEISLEDQAYYQKIQVPEPKQCPTCRNQRRLSHANLMNLYKRKCDKTGQDIISHYHQNVPFPVYEQSILATQEFDPTAYGQDYDFNKTFFEQYRELYLKVPRASKLTAYTYDENSEYTNHAGMNKNCYMLFDSDYNHDCMYGSGNLHCKSNCDNYRMSKSELCYQCIDCTNSYNLKFSQDCENCSDSAFLKNCIGCKECFMCSNLKNKQYYIFNQQKTKEEYEQYMQGLGSYSKTIEFINYYRQFIQNYPQRYIHGSQYENVSGDYLVNSKNAINCFDSLELWDCKNITKGFGNTKDSFDCDEIGNGAELAYECCYSGYNLNNCKFTAKTLDNVSNLYYCLNCNHSKDCFGCISAFHKQYCILNKQYTKEEYEALVPRIIEHMKQTGEYGEMIPIQLSDFAYNESDAQDWYPLTKDQALAKGFAWRDADPKEYLPATTTLKDNISETDQSITNELLACESCSKNYKIVPQEFKFYKNQNLPIPRQCFSCRHKNRHELRNKRQLFQKNCNNCQTPITTTYNPQSNYQVFCESCYQQSLA